MVHEAFGRELLHKVQEQGLVQVIQEDVYAEH
jgi:hypothetical protein